MQDLIKKLEQQPRNVEVVYSDEVAETTYHTSTVEYNEVAGVVEIS